MAQSLENGTRSKRNGNGHARVELRSRATDVLDDFTELRKDMNKLAQAASKAARAEVKTAGKRIETLGQEIRTRASTGADYVSESVRTHPGAAIGLSVGAGLLLGMFLATRR